MLKCNCTWYNLLVLLIPATTIRRDFVTQGMVTQKLLSQGVMLIIVTDIVTQFIHKVISGMVVGHSLVIGDFATAKFGHYSHKLLTIRIFLILVGIYGHINYCHKRERYLWSQVLHVECLIILIIFGVDCALWGRRPNPVVLEIAFGLFLSRQACTSHHSLE